MCVVIVHNNKKNYNETLSFEKKLWQNTFIYKNYFVIKEDNSHLYAKTLSFVNKCFVIKDDNTHFYDKTLSFVKMCFVIKDCNTHFYDKTHFK